MPKIAASLLATIHAGLSSAPLSTVSCVDRSCTRTTNLEISCTRPWKCTRALAHTCLSVARGSWKLSKHSLKLLVLQQREGQEFLIMFKQLKRCQKQSSESRGNARGSVVMLTSSRCSLSLLMLTSACSLCH